eukprot:s613_g2.t1
MQELKDNVTQCPPRGVVRTSRPMELSINLCVTGPVLVRCEQELKILVRVGDDVPERCMDVRMRIRAQLEPSVMRAPLEELLKLGRKPLLGEDRDSVAGQAGPLLPPKEMMSVMQWVLIQSRDMAPGSLVWWFDPMKEHSSRTDTELRELQRYVEHGWTFPRDTMQLSPLSGTLFLLKCLEVLPEPLLPSILVKDAAGDAKKVSSTLRSLPELPRVVLLTVLAFFTQLALRHGGRMDFTARFVSSLMQDAKQEQSQHQSRQCSSSAHSLKKSRRRSDFRHWRRFEGTPTEERVRARPDCQSSFRIGPV